MRSELGSLLVDISLPNNHQGKERWYFALCLAWPAIFGEGVVFFLVVPCFLLDCLSRVNSILYIGCYRIHLLVF